MKKPVSTWMLTALFCAILHESLIQAFGVHYGTYDRRFALRRSTALHAEDDGKETLSFLADFTLTSDPIRAAKDELISFFKGAECRDLLISAGGEREVYEIPMDDDMVSLWKEACAHWGPTLLPEKGDKTVAVETSVQFPGLKLKTITCNAIKLLSTADGMPEYEVILIAEKQDPQGPRPLVWLYDQLTGRAEKPKDKFLEPSGKAKSNVSIVEKEGSYAFKSEVKFQIELVFPRILIRILPMSKEKMEEQGSASILKVISKDVETSLKCVCETFNKRRSVPESVP